MQAEKERYENLKEKYYYNPFLGIFVNRKRGIIDGCIDSLGYVALCIRGEQIRGHRLAFLYMEGELPKSGVDHINGVKSDNRWANLRHADQSINMKNARIKSNNSSGITGVYWCKRKGKWQVQISIDGKHTSLGGFKCFFDACCIRKAAEIRYGYHENHGRRY